MNNHTETVSYGQNSTPSSIAAALTSAFNSDSNSPVTASVSGTWITLTSRSTGSSSDYVVTTGSSTSYPTHFSYPSFGASAGSPTLNCGSTGGASLVSICTPTVTTYSYNALSDLTNVVQAGSRQRTFTYDSLSRLTSSVNPESNTAPGSMTTVPTTYSYDADSNLTSKTEPAPNQTGTSTVTLNYCYDAGNRTLSKAYTLQSCPMASPIATYSYDGSSCLGQASCYNIGHRTGMTDLAGSEAWSYDKMGRVAVDQRTTNSVTKTTTYATQTAPYNLDGSIAQITYPSTRVITYSWGGAARPLSAVDSTTNVNYATMALYGPQGSIRSVSNSSSILSTLYYNSELQPCRIAVNATGTAPSSCSDATNSGNVMDYSYDFHLGVSDNGNVYKVTNNRSGASDRNINYIYDALNRISAAYTDGNLWGETYSIDNWGNLYGIGAYSGKPSGETLSQSVNSSNQLANACSANCYDSAGNMLSDGLSSYTYDAEGHTVTGAGVTYYNDGDGRRVEKSSGKLYWYSLLGEPLDETDLTGSVTNSNFFEYIFFDGKRVARRDASGNILYYFADHLGTSRAIVQAGQTTPCYDQDLYPFGREVPHGSEVPTFVNSCPQNYKFTGKERDSESGLDNFGARYDSSQYGRFMSVDPDNESGLDHMEDPQSWNGYAYVRNNPLVLTDPDGENYRVCDDNGDNCANLTNEQFAQYRQDSGNISMRASGDLYAGDTKVGNASYYDETNADGAAHIAGSQLVINEFAKQVAINATIGAIGRGIGLGIEAVQAARAANAAEEIAEVSNLATKAAATVGNQTASVGSKEAAAAAAKEFLGPGAEQITDRTTGAASGWKSADGTRVVIDSHADQVGEHMNFINKATGGNLHVRW